MRAQQEITPPRWADRLLAWYCKPELLEDLQGDLHECFARNVERNGVVRARLIYMVDVLKFFRLYIVRKPRFIDLLINWIMITSYVKTSGRTIVRNKLFSVINIVGLAISMSVGLLFIAVLRDTLSYDTFHTNHERIYRLISRYEFRASEGNGDMDDAYMATTSPTAARLVDESIASFEAVAVIARGAEGDWAYGEKILPFNGFWANQSLFDVFSFELISGQRTSALKDPYAVVLTERTAKKIFGDTDPLGKTMEFRKASFTVTGVMKDPPVFSSIKFDLLISYVTRETKQFANEYDTKWDNIWNTWAYALVQEGADQVNIKKQLDELSAREDRSVEHTHIDLKLQPLDAIMLGDDLGNQIGPVMGGSLLWIFGSLAFVVLLSACFNYTNLSIARSLRRSKEVGIRKVIGAVKQQVLGQFIVEATIISCCALVAALLLFVALRPVFLDLIPTMRELYRLELSPELIIYFVLFAVMVGVLAGLVPAFFFSRINPAQVLKGSVSTLAFKKVNVRKALVVVQYCLSIMFITATVIAFKQYRHFVAYDLGFKTENILNVDLQGNKAALLRDRLSELPEVKAISQSIIVTSIGNYFGTNAKNPAVPHDSAGVFYNIVDEHYLPLHGHHFLAGRNFHPTADSVPESEVIVNEQVLKRLNIGDRDPVKAIDELIIVDGKKLRIVGVLKDFTYGRANNRMRTEVLFRYSPTDAQMLNLKIESQDMLNTHARLEKVWKSLDDVHPFKARFYDDDIERAFADLRAAVTLAGVLAALAISISSMGLLGMVVFSTETRIREVGIRKALGATDSGLLLLLARSFLLLLGIAAVISLPLTYILFETVAFPSMANHAPISAYDMSIGLVVIVAIALAMIASQTLKVVRMNPAHVLKSE